MDELDASGYSVHAEAGHGTRGSVATCRVARVAGFTLIELLITVVIVGILAKIALPSMQEMILASYVRSAASDLQTDLYYARSEAVKRATNVAIVPCSAKYPPSCGSGSPDWTNGWVIQLPGTTPTVLKTHNALPDALSSMAGSTITYRDDGRVTSTPGKLTFKTSNTTVQARCISIDLSGRPDVTTYAYGGGTNSC